MKKKRNIPWNFIGFVVLGISLIPFANKYGWWIYILFGFLWIMIYFRYILSKARQGKYGEAAKAKAVSVKLTKHEIKAEKRHKERMAQNEKWRKERESKKK